MGQQLDYVLTPNPDGIPFYRNVTDPSGHVLGLCHKVKLRSQCIAVVSVCVHRTHTHTNPDFTAACSVSTNAAQAWGVVRYQKHQKDKVGTLWDSSLKKSFESAMSRIDLSIPYRPIARAQLGNFAHLTNGVCALVARMIQGGLSLQSLLSLSLYFACDVPPLSAAAWLPGDCVSSSHVRAGLPFCLLLLLRPHP